MMSRYCDSNKEKVDSKMAATNTNYGLIIFDSNSETFKEENTPLLRFPLDGLSRTGNLRHITISSAKTWIP